MGARVLIALFCVLASVCSGQRYGQRYDTTHVKPDSDINSPLPRLRRTVREAQRYSQVQEIKESIHGQLAQHLVAERLDRSRDFLPVQQQPRADVRDEEPRREFRLPGGASRVASSGRQPTVDLRDGERFREPEPIAASEFETLVEERYQSRDEFSGRSRSRVQVQDSPRPIRVDRNMVVKQEMRSPSFDDQDLALPIRVQEDLPSYSRRVEEDLPRFSSRVEDDIPRYSSRAEDSQPRFSSSKGTGSRREGSQLDQLLDFAGDSLPGQLESEAKMLKETDALPVRKRVRPFFGIPYKQSIRIGASIDVEPDTEPIRVSGIEVPRFSKMIKNNDLDFLRERERDTAGPIRLSGLEVPRFSQMIKNSDMDFLREDERSHPVEPLVERAFRPVDDAPRSRDRGDTRRIPQQPARSRNQERPPQRKSEDVQRFNSFRDSPQSFTRGSKSKIPKLTALRLSDSPRRVQSSRSRTAQEPIRIRSNIKAEPARSRFQEPQPVRSRNEPEPARQRYAQPQQSRSRPAAAPPAPNSPGVQGFRVKGDPSNRVIFLNVAELGFDPSSGPLKLGDQELVPIDEPSNEPDISRTIQRDLHRNMVNTHLQHSNDIHQPVRLPEDTSFSQFTEQPRLQDSSFSRFTEQPRLQASQPSRFADQPRFTEQPRLQDSQSSRFNIQQPRVQSQQPRQQSQYNDFLDEPRFESRRPKPLPKQPLQFYSKFDDLPRGQRKGDKKEADRVDLPPKQESISTRRPVQQSDNSFSNFRSNNQQQQQFQPQQQQQQQQFQPQQQPEPTFDSFLDNVYDQPQEQSFLQPQQEQSFLQPQQEQSFLQPQQQHRFGHPEPVLQIPGLESVLKAEADLVRLQGDKAFLYNRPWKAPQQQQQQQFQQQQFQQPQQFQQQQFQQPQQFQQQYQQPQQFQQQYQQPNQFEEQPQVPGLEAHRAQEQALRSTQLQFKANQPQPQQQQNFQQQYSPQQQVLQPTTQQVLQQQQQGLTDHARFISEHRAAEQALLQTLG